VDGTQDKQTSLALAQNISSSQHKNGSRNRSTVTSPSKET
jgi:hypothetical protein